MASDNSFFGRGAGFKNTTGTRNSFFGRNASDENNTGNDNSSFGFNAGKNNFLGNNNSFFGSAAGFTNTNGDNLTIVGAGADAASTNLNFASAFGSKAVVGTDDTIVIGKVAGTYDGIPRPADKIVIPGDLNIAGSFVANILSATTQFNLGGQRVLSSDVSGGNLFVGAFSGQSNLVGAGLLGRFNSFAGNAAGMSNSTGFYNSFFGSGAGAQTTTGAVNSFFGALSGRNNTTGGSNAFFGYSSGERNTTGTSNSFYGNFAGDQNITGANNTAVGYLANVGAGNLNFATAIGAHARVNTSNTVVLGRSADTVQVPGTLSITGTFSANTINAAAQFQLNGITTLRRVGFTSLIAGQQAATLSSGIENSIFGDLSAGQMTSGGRNSIFGFLAGGRIATGNDNTAFGTRAGSQTTGNGNSFFGSFSGANGAGSGSNNTFIGVNTDISITQSVGSNNTLLGADAKIAPHFNGADIRFATAIGAGASNTFSDMIILGKVAGVYDGVSRPADIVRTMGIFQPALSSPGGSPVCFNNGLSLCSSSLRYKTEIQPYFGGLDVAKRLNPITFGWKDDGRRDIGFGAEEVAKVEPLLTFNNEKGEIEGVHYAQITTVLVNAVKEQQAQIEALKKQIETLTILVCRSNSSTQVCRIKDWDSRTRTKKSFVWGEEAFFFFRVCRPESKSPLSQAVLK